MKVNQKHLIYLTQVCLIVSLSSSCLAPRKAINDEAVELNCPFPMVVTSPDSIVDSVVYNSLPFSENLNNAIISFGLQEYTIDKFRIESQTSSMSLADSLKLMSIEKSILKKIAKADYELEECNKLLLCHSYRYFRMRTNLGLLNNQTASRFANWAVISATAAVAAAIAWDPQNSDENSFDWIGIVGAGLAGLLTYEAERVDKKILVRDERNLLRAISSSEHGPPAFTTSVWHALNHMSFKGNSDISLRESIMENWLMWIQESEDKNAENNFQILLETNIEYNEELFSMRLEMEKEIIYALQEIRSVLKELRFELETD